MKRIVNGVTYNTATATALARSECTGDDGPVQATLYQTRGGAFFVDYEITREVWNEREQEHQTKITNTFEPLSREKAHEWILEGDIEIFNNPFDDPPEATAEADPGATIYIRVPASLKRNVDDAAKAAKTSGNVWAMRCVEKCLKETVMPDELAQAWYIAAVFREDVADGSKSVAALRNIADLLEEYSERHIGKDATMDALTRRPEDFEVLRREYELRD
jgi:hypothetical protein